MFKGECVIKSVPVIIDVLLSTYNGEKYLVEQLDSLLMQEFNDWHLFVRDDGSTDATLKIIYDYVELHPNKITLVNDSLGNLGTAKSFSSLIQKTTAPYLAFCDQDDVWLPNKLSLQFKKMKEAEKKYSISCPLLVHTDLIVVDKNLNEIKGSLWEYQKLSPEKMSSVNRLLMQNFVTGCACLINRSLANLSTPIPEKVVMHDWWIALIAQLKGKIINVNEPTIMYRQHGMNDTGAKRWGVVFILKQLRSGPSNMYKRLLKTRDQAIALSRLTLLTKNERDIVNNYIKMFQLNWIQRRVSMLQNGFIKHGFLRNIAILMYL